MKISARGMIALLELRAVVCGAAIRVRRHDAELGTWPW